MSEMQNTEDFQIQKLNIYLGTYSGSIVTVCINIKEPKNKIVKKSFKSSENSIKTLYPYNKEYIFSSGNDEIIRIYNLKTMQDKGIFVTYSGSISHLQIFKNKIYAIAENSIEVFNLKDFTKINTFTGHKNAINAILIHPLGKFFFSVGRDNYLMLWSIAKCKCTFRYKFPEHEVLNILWFKKEKYLIVVFSNKIYILDYSLDSEVFSDWIVFEHQIEKNFDNPSRIINVKTFKEKYILIFKANFETEVISIEKDILEKDKIISNFKICTLDAIDTVNTDSIIRLKLVDMVYGKFNFIVVISSDNVIIIYDATKIIKLLFEENQNKIQMKHYKKITLLVDRFTCLALSKDY
jgi:WD40 repeat protein